MQFLILLVFCFGVKANPTTTTDSCGIKIISKPYDFRSKDNEEYVTNDDYIIEPCSLDDYDCIRDFMAENSKCKRVYGPVPDPLYMQQATLYFPNSNLTFTFSKATVTGLSAATFISFSYNKKLKSLSFGLNVPRMYLESSLFFIIFRRPGLESISKTDYANITFNSPTFTSTMPKVSDEFRMELISGKVGYLPEAYPMFFHGPNSYNSTDPTAIAEYASLLENVPLDAKAVLLFLPEIFTTVFIQTFICDFGVKYYTV